MAWVEGMRWTLPEPMLATPGPDPALQSGWAGEPKWDGFRALLSVDAGRPTDRPRLSQWLRPLGVPATPHWGMVNRSSGRSQPTFGGRGATVPTRSAPRRR